MKRVRSQGAEEVYVLSAMLSLAGTLGWASFDGRFWSSHFYRTDLFGLVHVFTLGWLSLIIQGVLLRLAPMVLGTRTRSLRWLLVLAGLWIIGASGLASHMFRGEWFGVWTAGLCLWIAALFIPLSHPGLIKLAIKGDAVATYAVLGIGHLILAASLGIFIGLNKHLGLIAVKPYALLGAHFHLAEVGWVTFMMLGFGRKLLPITAPSAETEPRSSRLRLIGLELGLVLTAGSLLLGSRLLPVGASLLAWMLILHVAPLVRDLLRGRIKDRSTFWAAVAALFLVLDSLLGVTMACSLDRWLPWTRDRLLFAYGAIAFLGWNTLTIVSLALKLFPLWVWQERFGADWGVRPVPRVTDLYRPWLREATGIGLTLGTLLTAAGLLQGSGALAQWGVRVVFAGVVCFLVNFVLMARWEMFDITFTPGPSDWERFHALRREKDVSSSS